MMTSCLQNGPARTTPELSKGTPATYIWLLDYIAFYTLIPCIVPRCVHVSPAQK